MRFYTLPATLVSLAHTKKVLPRNLRAARALAGLTQHQLAEAVGVKRASIGAYEEGRCEPPTLVLSRWAALANISLNKLVGNV